MAKKELDKVERDEILDKDFNKSAARLTELKAGRHVDDIPLTDEYWLALKKHMKAYGK